MKCKDIQKKLYDYTKGEISIEYKNIIEEHIKNCHYCSSELKKIQKIKNSFINNIMEPSNSVYNNLKNRFFPDFVFINFFRRFKFAFVSFILLIFLFIGTFLYKNKIDSNNNLTDFIYNSYYFIEIYDDDNNEPILSDIINTDFYM